MKTTHAMTTNAMVTRAMTTRAISKIATAKIATATSRCRPLRRTLALTAAITAAGWLLFGGVARAQTTPTPPMPTAEPTAEPSSCDVSTRMWARPEVVPAGSATNVTATLNFGCPGGATSHQHIALVLDASSSVVGDTRAQLVSSMNEFIDRLEFGGSGLVQVAVIEFNTDAKVLCELTDRASMLHACVGRLASYDSSCIDCGVTAAHAALARGRAAVPRGEALSEVMIVFTDGANAAGCDALTAAAADAKSDRIRIVTIALAPGGDVACMRTTATTPRYFFAAHTAGQMANIMDTVRKQQTAAMVQHLSLRLRLAPEMAYVDGSAQPMASSIVSNTLVWDQSWLPESGVTFTLKVRPQVAGALPVLAAAEGDLVDNQDRTAPFSIDIPQILALSGGVLPTATPQAAM
ncbi:MAG: vWA domain-containing protein, partial [Ardenticatenales bacterium]